MNTVTPEIINDAGSQLHELVQAALRNIKEANSLPLPELPVGELISWLERVSPDCHDVELIAAALYIRLRQRHGELVRTEGERRGGDQTQSVPEFTPAEHQRRYESKQVSGPHAAAVDQYVAENLRARRKPSMRGAIRLAKSKSKPAFKPKPKPRSKPEPRSVKYVEYQPASEKTGILQLSADGKPLDYEDAKWHPGQHLFYVVSGCRFREVVVEHVTDNCYYIRDIERDGALVQLYRDPLEDCAYGATKLEAIELEIKETQEHIQEYRERLEEYEKLKQELLAEQLSKSA
jgi:hypothetical protein